MKTRKRASDREKEKRNEHDCNNALHMHISVDAHCRHFKRTSRVDSVTVFVCCCHRRLFNNLSVWIFLCFWFLLSHVALFVCSCVYVISLYIYFFLLLLSLSLSLCISYIILYSHFLSFAFSRNIYSIHSKMLMLSWLLVHLVHIIRPIGFVSCVSECSASVLKCCVLYVDCFGFGIHLTGECISFQCMPLLLLLMLLLLLLPSSLLPLVLGIFVVSGGGGAAAVAHAVVVVFAVRQIFTLSDCRCAYSIARFQTRCTMQTQHSSHISNMLRYGRTLSK